MSAERQTPGDRRYTTTHEWFKAEGDELVVGITDHAQRELTDVVYVDLPAVGKAAVPKQSLLALESVKTVADVYAPVAGTVSAVNAELTSHPELVNQDPYGKGWLYRLQPSGPVPPDAGMSADEYQAHVKAHPH
jgi:glycine cleavage system H protein